MTNILFILFLGNGENIKIWNENTKSKFLDRLKTLGDVYVYQDKSYNIIHYDLSDKKYLEYNNDINFDIYSNKCNDRFCSLLIDLFSDSLVKYCIFCTHTHTHTHIYIYVYI